MATSCIVLLMITVVLTAAGRVVGQVHLRGLQGLPDGTSLSASEYEGLLGLLGANGTTRVTSLYRTSVHGTTYGDLLDRVGDAKPLVFVVRNGEYVFGAVISEGIRLPDSSTGYVMYPCKVWWFSLAGHFEKPIKINLYGQEQIVYAAGREGHIDGANVRIGGRMWLGWSGLGPGRPADDIRSCRQYTTGRNVPSGYTGEREEDEDALLGGSKDFMAEEIEVLHWVQ